MGKRIELITNVRKNILARLIAYYLKENKPELNIKAEEIEMVSGTNIVAGITDESLDTSSKLNEASTQLETSSHSMSEILSRFKFK